MLRTFQFRLRPNATQATMLTRILADNCETYNACLQERIGAWKLQRKSISYRDQQDQITELRKDSAFNWIACDIQRDPLRRIDRAFKAFFRRVKTGGSKPGFPPVRITESTLRCFRRGRLEERSSRGQNDRRTIQEAHTVYSNYERPARRNSWSGAGRVTILDADIGFQMTDEQLEADQ